MRVKVKKGTKCPKEGRPREYVTDGEAVEVPETAYYRRLVRDGSLVIAPEKRKTKRKEVKDSGK